MPRTAQTVPTPPRLTKDDLRYFRSVQGGHGQKVLNAWNKGVMAPLGHLKGMIVSLERSLKLQKDPDWGGNDPKVVKPLEKLIAKVQDYSEAAYPGGKKPKKTSPATLRREMFLKGVMDSKIQGLAKKIIKEYGKDPLLIAAFGTDVLEDVNFHSGSRAFDKVIPLDWPDSWGTLTPGDVGSKISWGVEEAGELAVALLLLAGKKALAKKAMSTLLAVDDRLWEIGRMAAQRRASLQKTAAPLQTSVQVHFGGIPGIDPRKATKALAQSFGEFDLLDTYTKASDVSDKVTKEDYDEVTFTGAQRDVDDWDEWTSEITYPKEVQFTYKVRLSAKDVYERMLAALQGMARDKRALRSAIPRFIADPKAMTILASITQQGVIDNLENSDPDVIMEGVTDADSVENTIKFSNGSINAWDMGLFIKKIDASAKVKGSKNGLVIAALSKIHLDIDSSKIDEDDIEWDEPDFDPPDDDRSDRGGDDRWMDYINASDQKLRSKIIRLAHANPDMRPHLLPMLKKAGKFSMPVFNKMESIVTPRRIINLMKKEGGYDMGFFDLSKIEFDTVDKDQYPPHPYQGYQAIWRIFPPGEFGNRKSEYIWGYVFAGLASTGKGIQVIAHMTLNM